MSWRILSLGIVSFSIFGTHNIWGILSQVIFPWGILTQEISENVSSCPELQVVKMEFSVSVDWRILTKRKGNSETLPDPEIGENVSSCH